MDTLSLVGLQFYGHHGTESWEQEVGRRFSADVEIEIDLTAAGRSDRLADAIDYCAVYQAVRYVMEEERHELIERLAWRILEELFRRFDQARAVRARVSKPEAPIGGINAAAVVDLKRTRREWENA
ncbi:MAG: dihydroneopterin aldolase [Candidatus Sumerlaeia bacterium]